MIYPISLRLSLHHLYNHDNFHLTKLFINRIERFDSVLHTYITPLPELALRQAVKAESEIMRGEYKGALHGIPLGVKDNYKTKDIRTTDGSKLFIDFVPNVTATSIKKLLAAGSTGTNPFFGTTRNPWNIDYMPGGSSGGGTASLAAGLSVLSTGTDTFGSIRQPAAMCGVYGLKPTYGLVSTFGVFPSAWSLDTAGPMARSVSDLALMLNEMAGFDPQDPASLRVKIPNYIEGINRGIRGVKIGVPTYFLEGLDSDVERLFQQALTILSSLGAVITEVSIPELTMATFAGFVTVAGEASAFHYEWLQNKPEDYSADIRTFLLSGTLTSATQYIRAQQVRRRLVEAMNQAFMDVDILLAPTIPFVTPTFSENWVEQNLEVVKRTMPFTAPVTLAGIPGLAVPMGLDRRGLPVGMQLMGKHLSEKLLLQVGHAWESVDPLRITLQRTKVR